MNSYPTELFSERRRQFQEAMEADSVAIFFSSEPAHKSNDTHYRFRQDTDFFYLTGLDEEQSALVMTNDQAVLFLRERDPAMEQWVGRRLGVEAAPDALYSVPLTERMYIES